MIQHSFLYFPTCQRLLTWEKFQKTKNSTKNPTCLFPSLPIVNILLHLLFPISSLIHNVYNVCIFFLDHLRPSCTYHSLLKHSWVCYLIGKSFQYKPTMKQACSIITHRHFPKGRSLGGKLMISLDERKASPSPEATAGLVLILRPVQSMMIPPHPAWFSRTHSPSGGSTGVRSFSSQVYLCANWDPSVGRTLLAHLSVFLTLFLSHFLT